MMSPEFYETFAHWEYILIYQADAWVLSDRLSEWCSKGYDSIGAPWTPKPKNRKLYYRIFNFLKRGFCYISGSSDYSRIYYRVGNGGLSLRRGESFRAARDRDVDARERFSSMGNHLGNEDVFWAVVPEGFRYPSQEEALRFAFDTNPRYCYRLCGSRLPMGCHSWSKPRMWRFWQQIIPLPGAASGAAADK